MKMPFISSREARKCMHFSLHSAKYMAYSFQKFENSLCISIFEIASDEHFYLLYKDMLQGKFLFQVIYFVNSGSEANDLALLMSRMYTGVFDVVSLRYVLHLTYAKINKLAYLLSGYKST